MTVSPDDPRPPYLQVADDLRASIASGVLAPGARLASGRDLAQQYGVSLMTLQKAVVHLQDEGLMVSYQGRGTFVSDGPRAEPTPSVEFVAISEQLSQLRDLIERTAETLDARLTALEAAAQMVGATPPAPKPQR